MENSNSLELDLEKLMIPKFISCINDNSRYLNLIGSRGSGKSTAAAQIIILRMITHKFFRGVGIRLIENTIEDSIYTTIIDVINEWNLQEYFHVLKSPKKIICKINNNYLIMRGLDKPKTMKSLREASFVFFEEETCLTLEDFNAIDKSIRTQQADFVQIMHCLNPTLEGNPEDHWFYKFMFYDRYNGMDFVHTTSGEFEGVKVSYKTTSVHSSFKDNNFLPFEYKFKLENETDEYSYQVDTLGIWARKIIDGRFYKSFSVKNNTEINSYDRDKHLYIGIDFNLFPFSAITVFQLEGKHLYQIDEICVNDPVESSLRVALRTFVNRYKNHYLDVYVYGDSTGKKEDAAHEKGYNNYSIVQHELRDLKVQMRVPSSNPSVIARGEFTNDVFLNCFNGIKLSIHSKCQNTINDFLYLKADFDGTIKKEMIKDKETGKTFERWGHTSDSTTYILCELFKNDFEKFKNPGAGLPISMGQPRKPKWF